MNLWNCICRYHIRPDVEDSWQWNGSRTGIFSTMGMYKSLVEPPFDDPMISFPWLKIWWKVVPLKKSLFEKEFLQKTI